VAENQSELRITVFVNELMISPVLTVRTNATVAEAAKQMLMNRIGSVVVVDENGHYAGFLTERMMLPEEALIPFMRGKAFRVLGREIGNFEMIEETIAELSAYPVGDVMSTDHPTVAPDTHIGKAVELMVSKNVHHVCVVENRIPVGVLSKHDLLKLFFIPSDGPSVRALL
jgi:CBS domain-containing protein